MAGGREVARKFMILEIMTIVLCDELIVYYFDLCTGAYSMPYFL